MTRYRIKLILLSLGVVVGFGSAIAHRQYWHEHGHHGPGAWGECWHDGGSWGGSRSWGGSDDTAPPKSSAAAQGSAPKTH